MSLCRKQHKLCELWVFTFHDDDELLYVKFDAVRGDICQQTLCGFLCMCQNCVSMYKYHYIQEFTCAYTKLDEWHNEILSHLLNKFNLVTYFLAQVPVIPFQR